METIRFKVNNVCAREMAVEHEDGIITNVQIVGGCRGNTQGICKLLVGMKIEDAISRLEGIECRNGTSCPDQLAKGLKSYLNNK